MSTEAESHIQLYVRQIEQGFNTLRFAPELEIAFRRFYAAQTLRRTRVALLLGVALFVSFAFVYFNRLPEHVRNAVFYLDTVFIIPMLLLTLGLSYVCRAQPWIPLLVVACVLAAGLARISLYAYVYAGADRFVLPYEGLLIISMTAYFLVGISFYRALGATALILVAYVAAMRMVGLPATELAMSAFYLAAVTVIGAVGCYIIEYSVRYNYLYNRLSVYYAENDALTGLSNRRVFMESLERTWRLAKREGKSVAVCLVDVDCFKLYNDHFGHLEGDRALKAIAEAIARSVRRPLDTAARYGGEEFVIVWYDIAQHEAPVMGQRLLNEVRMLALAHPHSLAAEMLTVSAGIAVGSPADAVNPIQLLRQADDSLYRAKQNGRNRCEFAQ